MVQDLYIVNMPHPHGWAEAIRDPSSSQAADSAYVLSFVNPIMAKELTMFDNRGLKSIFVRGDECCYVSSSSSSSSSLLLLVFFSVFVALPPPPSQLRGLDVAPLTPVASSFGEFGALSTFRFNFFADSCVMLIIIRIKGKRVGRRLV